MENDEKKSQPTVTRRSALAATTMLGSAAALGSAATPRPAQAQAGNDISVAQDGNYERAPLKKTS